MPSKQLSLSPSLAHRRMMDEMEPALAFRDEYRGGVKAWQSRLRRKLRTLMGCDVLPREKTPLNVRSLWRRETELGSIEKLALTAQPGADVPAYLCLPRNATPPYPVFICLQGHSTGMHNSIAVAADDEKTPITPEGDRDFAIGCMKRGFAALCIEQRAFGERRERHVETMSKNHLTCHEASMHALMLGTTLAAERVYDVDRAIDLLATRDDIDMSRLGVMGNSGGGLISILAGALLPRIRFMMPSCGFCTYRESIMTVHHCVDNYIPGLLRVAEMSDVLGLFASRPVVVVAGRADPLFPIKGVRRAFRETQAIYAAAGAEDHCKLVVGPGGHRFYADLAWPKMLKLLKPLAA